ncbi:unnamed protein product [Fraxinus pennsylvanica]|uniref:Uncharacterized protein n=1 Tax=Fraxinus pennsylvanica TaxID=56036 RepID=A0AAD2DL64_9LAMI|nr:unnamed protein product [Fraxinus pennsylvanica]
MPPFIRINDKTIENQASPITIDDLQAVVERKRTTTRVGSGRGRFTSARGGFRNDSYRSRGNFNVVRVYVRRDSFRARGNFSSVRGGEGYQGRGRGEYRGGLSQNATST